MNDRLHIAALLLANSDSKARAVAGETLVSTALMWADILIAKERETRKETREPRSTAEEGAHSELD